MYKFMLVPDHNFVPSTNLPWKIKSYIPDGRNSAFSTKPQKVFLKSICIYHTRCIPGWGGGTPFSTKITPFFYDNTQSTSENHISRPPNVSLAMFRNILNRKSGADVNKSLIRQYLKNYQTQLIEITTIMRGILCLFK